MKNKQRIFIQAVNIHEGGGATLLTELLVSIPNSLDAIIQIDNRYRIPPNTDGKLKFMSYAPTIYSRLKSEWVLRQLVGPNDIILCFGNLPPIFRQKCKVFVFIQNKFLVGKIPRLGLPILVRFRLILERRWLEIYSSNSDVFVVQSLSMKDDVLKTIGAQREVCVQPFAKKNNHVKKSVRTTKPSKIFAYVASGLPYKNHKNLISAWCLLAEEGIFPTLFLTFDDTKFNSLSEFLSQKVFRFGLKITNLGELTPTEVARLYSEIDALIYPSVFESFGLPLVEAEDAGLPILASEIDYVRDLVEPDQTFDAESPISIARAVKRHIGEKDLKANIRDGTDFLDFLVQLES